MKQGEKRAKECNLYSYTKTHLSSDSRREFYLADDVHKLLGSGHVITSHGSKREWYKSDCSHREDTHSALLINIRPIKERSREDKIVELIKVFIEDKRLHAPVKDSCGEAVYEFCISARKFLSEVAK